MTPTWPSHLTVSGNCDFSWWDTVLCLISVLLCPCFRRQHNEHWAQGASGKWLLFSGEDQVGARSTVYTASSATPASAPVLVSILLLIRSSQSQVQLWVRTPNFPFSTLPRSSPFSRCASFPQLLHHQFLPELTGLWSQRHHTDLGGTQRWWRKHWQCQWWRRQSGPVWQGICNAVWCAKGSQTELPRSLPLREKTPRAEGTDTESWQRGGGSAVWAGAQVRGHKCHARDTAKRRLWIHVT